MHGARRVGATVEWARRHWYLPVALVVGTGGVVLLLSLWFQVRTASYRYQSVAEVPARKVAIVLGASVLRSGRPSEMLRDRLDTGLALYRAGKVRKILLTGDGGRPGYDEVTVMRKHVLAAGANPADVFTDDDGVTTRDSVLRARVVFGIDSAIVVTQAFHLPRAVYLARGIGLPALGVEADRRRYRSNLYQTFREAFARVKAFVDVQTPVWPRDLGPRIDIDGDGRASWRHARPRRPGHR
jgi:SanA protein